MSKILKLITILSLILTIVFQNTALAIIDVQNLPPNVGFKMLSKKKIDLVINAGQSITDLIALQNKVNTIIKPKLAANNIDTTNIQVINGETIVVGEISNGEGQTVFRKPDGTVWTTGSNHYRQLSSASTGYDSNVPVKAFMIDAVQVATSGNHVLALKKDGTVWAWGEGDFGQLGDGFKTQAQWKPVQTKNLTNIIAITAGYSSSAALKEDGTVWEWGSRTGSLPVKIPIMDVIAIDAGHFFMLALKRDGTVWAWGDGGYGQLGDGTYVSNSTPVQVKISNVKAISAGTRHAIALKSDGTVWGWGSNEGGALGKTPSTDTYNTPIQIIGISDAVKIDAGDGHNIALRSNNTAWTWGRSAHGRLADNQINDRATPMQVATEVKDVSIESEARNTFIIKTDGTVWAAGDGSWGQLGDGTWSASGVFKPVVGGETGAQYMNLISKSATELSVVLPSLQWRNEVHHYFADLNDVMRPELSDVTKSQVIQEKLLRNSTNFIALGTTTNKTEFQNLITQNNGNGIFIDNTNIDAALSNLADYIISQMNSQPAQLNQYVLINTEFTYETSYSDTENDPQFATRWLYNQDANYYDNSMGTIAENGQWVSNPISPFMKVGKYDVTYQGRDNPKNDDRFDNYRLWSYSASPATIYVHRKPYAFFTVSFISRNADRSLNTDIQDWSYDLDHTSKANKGIVARTWKWKAVTATTWNNGTPTVLPENQDFLVQLQVQDEEGVWSYPNVQLVSTKNVNLSPKMVITQPNGTQLFPNIYGNDPLLTWNYTDPENDPQQQYKLELDYVDTGTVAYTVQQSNGSNQFQIPNGTLQHGRLIKAYGYVYDGHSWSPQSNVVYFKINSPPTVSILTAPNPVYENDTVTVSVTPNDPDGDATNLVVEQQLNGGGWSIIWTKNSASSGQTQTFVIPNMAIGTYTLRVTATDPSGAFGIAQTTFIVNPLSVSGQVRHTAQWELNRQSWNENPNLPYRVGDVFWTGEKFMLTAVTTNTGTGTQAASVTVELLGYGYSATLSAEDASQTSWSGSLWDQSFESLPDGPLTFRFTATWNNGTVKTYDVIVQISGVWTDYYQVHRNK